MLGHLSFGVRDLERTTHVLRRVLAPLGYVRVWTSERGIGFGEGHGDERLTLFVRPDDAQRPGPGFHLAFDAPTQAAVDAFHRRRCRPAAATPGRPACGRTTAPPTTPLS